MQVIETQNEGLKRQYKVTLAAGDISNRLDSRLTELSRSLRLPGFRPGKVPTSLMRQRYGNAVYKEVLEDMARDSSDELLRERHLRPSRQPQVSASTIEKNGDFVYELAVEILPEIKVMDLSTLDLTREIAEISESDIDHAFEEFSTRFPKYDPAESDHVAAMGDRVIIDFTGKLNGTAFEGGTATDFSLDLGSGQFVPGFEEGLVGSKIGDQRTLEIKFPDDYKAAHLAGQTTEFDVTVKQINVKAKESPAEMVARVGFETVDSLRDFFKDQLTKEFEQQSRTKLKIKLLDQLNVQHDFPLPMSMVEDEFKTIWAQLFENEGNVPPPPLPPKQDDTSDDAAKAEDHPMMSLAQQREYRQIAERRVRVGLVLSEIARLNQITVSDGEMRHAMRDTAQNYRGQEKRILDFLQKNPAAQERLRGPILEEKIVNFIFQLTKVKETKVSRDELFAVEEEVSALTDKNEEAAKDKKASAKSAKKSAKPKGDAKGDDAVADE
ncbi:MAG: trigger factor [Candidatus Symbiobacter sp.]|nr:trigger factor [Candidatus Symbiobacter sp.]